MAASGLCGPKTSPAIDRRVLSQPDWCWSRSSTFARPRLQNLLHMPLFIIRRGGASAVSRERRPGEGILGPIVVYQSRGKLAAILFGSFLLDVLFVLLLARHPESMPAKTTVEAVVGVPFFGACGLFALSRLLWRKPAIIIDNDGLTDHASGASLGFIPWSDIADARIIVQSFAPRDKGSSVSLSAIRTSTWQSVGHWLASCYGQTKA